MNSDWFSALDSSLAKLEQRNVFSSCKMMLGHDVIEVLLQNETGFFRFKKAWSIIEAAGSPCFKIYCLQSNQLSALPEMKLKCNQMDRLGNYQSPGGRQFILCNKELVQVRVIDLDYGYALFVTEDASALPSWDYYSPLKEIFHVWCLFNNKLLLHAGSICKGGVGVLFLGFGGAGKSTATTQALDMGYQSCGDDYVIVCLKTLTVMNLYRSLKLLDSALFNISGCLSKLPCEYDQHNQKKVYMVPQNSGVLVQDFKLIKLLQLKRNDCYQISSAVLSGALIKLMLSTTMQIPLLLGLQFKAIAKLLELVDCYDCSLGLSQPTLRESINRLMSPAKGAVRVKCPSQI